VDNGVCSMFYSYLVRQSLIRLISLPLQVTFAAVAQLSCSQESSKPTQRCSLHPVAHTWYSFGITTILGDFASSIASLDPCSSHLVRNVLHHYLNEIRWLSCLFQDLERLWIPQQDETIQLFLPLLYQSAHLVCGRSAETQMTWTSICYLGRIS